MAGQMRNKLESKPIHFRYFIWQLVIATIFFIFLIRLIDLQIIRGKQFKQIADNNRLFHRAIPAERGVILDRYGDPLTLNAKQYLLINNPKAIYSDVSEISHEEALAYLASDSARVSFRHYRVYPWGSSLAHVLGYVGPVTSEDLIADPALRPNDQIGKSGLEKALQRKLRGVAGLQQLEINAPGEEQRIVKLKTAVAGQNIQTGLDPYLSQVAETAMHNQPGAVVINDLDTGQILALVSTPSFDPNLLTQPVKPSKLIDRSKLLNKMFDNPAKLFFNRALSGTYPPGSIFKIVTALAALENEAIDAQTTITDNGVLKVGEYTYANWYYTQYGRTEGPLQLVKALARSNDIFFYKAAELVGPDRLATMAKLLGMGRVTGIEIGSEAKGLIPDPSWKETNLAERWYLGNTYHMAIGQGDVLATPIQLAQLLQVVIKGDQICQPSLFMSEQSLCKGVSLAEDNLELVREGMIRACSKGGTAFPFFSYNAQYQDREFTTQKNAINQGMAACKTGTAEFGKVREDGFRRTHAWFVVAFGFQSDQAKTSKPEGQEQLAVEAKLRKLHQEWLSKLDKKDLPRLIGITVLLESTDQNPYREGSRDAGPVAKKIMNWMHTGQLGAS